MGIRVHKALCYALEDVKVKDYRIVDDRFSDWFLDEETDAYYECAKEKFEPFIKWILDESNKDLFVKILEEANGPSKGDAAYIFVLRHAFRENSIEKLRKEMRYNFISETEFGIPSLFGIVPFEGGNFYRYDDQIDYYEETYKDRKEDCQINTVKWLDIRNKCSGVYPFQGLIKIPNSPDIEGLATRLFPSDMIFYKNEDEIDKISKSYRPMIHTSVILWTYYLGIFKDWKTTVNQLRPCLYTWWS